MKGKGQPSPKRVTMSSDSIKFILSSNTVSGAQEWRIHDEAMDSDEDESTVLVGTQYIDMINDHARNEAYRKAVSRVVKKGMNVLDIGTGTGLLAMFAIQAGASLVTACEVYKPMALLAEKVIKDNLMSEKIRVVSKRSTDLGASETNNQLADVIVTEIFDSELLGEGMLPSVRHAFAHLTKKGASVIPASATVWGVLIESDFLRKFHDLSAVYRSTGSPCVGVSSPWEIHFDRVRKESFSPLSLPVKLFEFDFHDPSIPTSDSKSISISLNRPGFADCLLTWFDFVLDKQGTIRVSTAPAAYGGCEWRDHWKQCLYFFPERIKTSGGSVVMNAARDEFSLWYNIGETRTDDENFTCQCGYHAWWRPRMFQINDMERTNILRAAIARHVSANDVGNELCVCVGAGLHIALLTAEFFKSVCVFEGSPRVREAVKRTLLERGIENVSVFDAGTEELVLLRARAEPAQIDLVISEPHYGHSEGGLEWANLTYWYDLQRLRKFCTASTAFVPRKATLFGRLAHTPTIRKRFEKVDVPGLTYTRVDQLVELTKLEPFAVPLWQYEHEFVSEAMKLMEFSFDSSPASSSTSLRLVFEEDCDQPNVIVAHIVYYVDDNTPIPRSEEGSYVAVIPLPSAVGDGASLTTTFDAENCHINFTFSE